MSFLAEGDFGVLSGDDLLHEIDEFDFYSSENSFSDDCLMNEFESDSPTPETDWNQSGSGGASPPSQLAQPSQWTSYQPPPTPFSQHPPQQLTSAQFPPQGLPQHHLQQRQQQLPQHPTQHFQQQQQQQHQHQQQHQQQQQQAFGYPQYSPPFQHQQQRHQQQFSNSSFPPRTSQGWEVPKTNVPASSLRPLAPQVANGQYLVQLSSPPSPPPPPPKGHLTSMATPTPFSQAPILPFLAPSLSDSETRYLTEDSAGELRLIAPKPPSLPPADFHRRSTQKPPHDSINSPVSPARRTRGKAKRRSTLKQEQKIKLQVTKEPRFLGGSELQDRFKILSDKCAASEAESMALKQRLNETESELAALRLKMQTMRGASGETF